MRRLTTGLLLMISVALMAQAPSPAPRLVVVVRSVNLTNDSSISSENLRRIESKRHALGYPPDPGRFVAKIAQSELESNGYFNGEVTTAATEVLSETATKRYISVTLCIREGQQYRLKQIDFENNEAIPSTQLRQAFDIKDGDVADHEKLDRGTRAMADLYAKAGYMQIAPVVKTSFNHEARTLTWHVDVQEGPQFTVAGLTPEGSREWPADQAAKLQDLARTSQGSHSVGLFISAVKQTPRDIFPGCDPYTLVAVTARGK